MTEQDLLHSIDPTPQPVTRGGFTVGNIVLITGVILFAAVIGIALLRGQQTQPTSGQAPDFSLTTFDGEPFRLSDQRGRIVLVNFWASWCAPCREEAPLLEAIWQDYRNRGVVVVGIAYADLDSESRAFIEAFGVTYPNGADVGTLISKNQYHIIGVPESFIIDQNGQIQRFFFQILPDSARGDGELYVTDASIRATLESLLAQAESAS
jgi:cytochrome c biogenesis protein CcmG/thiol:disulfide interchange protein DsbE